MVGDSAPLEFGENGRVGPAPGEGGQRILRPLNALWPFLKWSMLAYIVITVISQFAFTAMSLMVFGDLGEGVSFASFFPVLVGAGFLTSFVSILCIVAYCRFVHRAMNNVHVLMGSEGLISPTGSWLWHIVPIIGFYMPYKAALQVWHHSRAHAGMTPDTPRWLYIWWAGWVLPLIFSIASIFIPSPIAGPTSGVLGAYSPLGLVLEIGIGLLGLIGSLAFLKIASGINRAQLHFEEEGLSSVFS